MGGAIKRIRKLAKQKGEPWESEIQGYDAEQARAEEKRKGKEVTMTDAGIKDASAAQKKPAAVKRKRRKPAGVGAAQLAFHLSVPASLSQRRRGVPGNTAGRAGIRG